MLLCSPGPTLMIGMELGKIVRTPLKGSDRNVRGAARRAGDRQVVRLLLSEFAAVARTFR